MALRRRKNKMIDSQTTGAAHTWLTNQRTRAKEKMLRAKKPTHNVAGGDKSETQVEGEKVEG